MDLAEEGRFELIISELLLEEARDVLMRPKFRRYLPEVAVSAFLLDRLPSFAFATNDPEEVPSHTEDPKDDYLVALALAAGADLVVSGDRHLLDLEDEGLPKTIRPVEFLKTLDPR